MIKYDHIFREIKLYSGSLALLSDDTRNEILNYLADLTDKSHEDILRANEEDLLKMNTSDPLYDRLKLTDKRLDDISSSLRYVASLPSPIDDVIEKRKLPNGILLKKIRVPFGVVGIIYEARPNVTFDVFALCFKSGNASVLKGGKNAETTNLAIIKLIHKALLDFKVSELGCTLLPSSHESTQALLEAVGYVDVCIPRGGKNLIKFVRNNAKIPVIETGAGVVHTYFDKDGDKRIGIKIIENGKTRRVSVCNALDSLLIHQDRLDDLSELVMSLACKKVELFADKKAFDVLKKSYPSNLLHRASKDDCNKEWMDFKMGVYVVPTLDEAIKHISEHGSGHSESIITENPETADKFCKSVDAACVYINLPTSFTDGGEFGLGAEIGISTQKLGPRGPMGLKEITTFKYVLEGKGQTRP